MKFIPVQGFLGIFAQFSKKLVLICTVFLGFVAGPFIFVSLISSAEARSFTTRPEYRSPESRSDTDVLDRFVMLSERSLKDREIESANCLGHAPNLAELDASWSEWRGQSPSVHGKIVGTFRVKGDSRILIEAAQKLIPPLESTHELADCDDAVCAVKGNLGPTIGPKLLYMLVEFGFNGSHLAFPKEADPWTDDELDDVISALRDFPSNVIRNVYDNRMLVRTLTPSARGSYGVSRILFFKPWTEMTRSQRRYLVFHEVSHTLAQLTSVDSHSAFLSLSHWQSAKNQGHPVSASVKDWHPNSSNDFPSFYASQNPAEDFAESSSAYRYHPSLLKEISYKKYLFFKKVIFDGIEYTTSDCGKQIPESAQLSKLFQKHKTEPTPKDWPSLFKSCHSAFLKELVRRISLESGEAQENNREIAVCLQDQVIKRFALSTLAKERTFGKSGVYALAPIFQRPIATSKTSLSFELSEAYRPLIARLAQDLMQVQAKASPRYLSTAYSRFLETNQLFNPEEPKNADYRPFLYDNRDIFEGLVRHTVYNASDHSWKNLDSGQLIELLNSTFEIEAIQN